MMSLSSHQAVNGLDEDIGKRHKYRNTIVILVHTDTSNNYDAVHKVLKSQSC